MLFKDLREDTVMVGLDLNVWVEAECTLTSNLSLGLSNVLLVEQKLAIQVTDVDCVQVNLKRLGNIKLI